MTYAWIIDADRVTTGDLPPRVGWTGPRDAPADLLAVLNDGGGLSFRMRCDGDADACYAGRIATTAGRFEALTETQAFGPLDDLGRPDAGCVAIEYLVHGEWLEI